MMSRQITALPIFGRSRRFFLGPVCFAAFWAAAFATAFAPARADQAQERQYGQQIFSALQSQGAIVTQSPYYAVLREVGEKIDQAAGPHWFVMNFIIIHGNQPNAFSAPGGNVYVTEGLLRTVDNKDELANVLGHETAHLILGHITERLTQAQRATVFQRLNRLFVHNTGSQNTIVAANAAINYSFLNFTRQQEYAADQEGAYLAARGGFNPWGTVWFFRNLASTYGDAGFEQYVQQHPSTHDRIERVSAAIRAQPARYGRWPQSLSVTTGLPRSSVGDTLTLRSR
jgi:predicted Zn-dependent protease